VNYWSLKYGTLSTFFMNIADTSMFFKFDQRFLLAIVFPKYFLLVISLEIFLPGTQAHFKSERVLKNLIQKMSFSKLLILYITTNRIFNLYQTL
jgi:hypothetical protein